MSSMSRSARNRQNRRASQKRGSTPKGTPDRTNQILRSERIHNTPGQPIQLRPSDVRLPTKNRRPGQDKGQGEWRTVSQNYMTPITIDSRWSK